MKPGAALPSLGKGATQSSSPHDLVALAPTAREALLRSVREARLGSSVQAQPKAGGPLATGATASSVNVARSRLSGLPVRKVGDPLSREDLEARPPSGEFLTGESPHAPEPDTTTFDRASVPATRRKQEPRQETIQFWSPAVAARAKGASDFAAARPAPRTPPRLPSASARAVSETALTNLHVVKTPQPMAANPFALENPFASVPPPVAPSWLPNAPAWTPDAETQDSDGVDTVPVQDAVPLHERTTWVDGERKKFRRPSDVVVTLLTKVRSQSLVLVRSAQERYAQLRSDLRLVALRAHGVVVHRTRGRLGAILLATSPVLLLSAAAAIWLSLRAPAAKQQQLLQPAVEIMPSDAEIARILRSRTGFTVTTEPAGAHIYVDGFATGRVTPERVTGFAAGLHSVELKRTGYYDTNLAAVLEEGSTLVMPPVILQALPNSHEQPAEQ